MYIFAVLLLLAWYGQTSRILFVCILLIVVLFIYQLSNFKNRAISVALFCCVVIKSTANELLEFRLKNTYKKFNRWLSSTLKVMVVALSKLIFEA